ncbi:MAG: hypothetical protein ACYC91_09925 [Solirubrobacteraceae bacterium]
MSSGSLTDPRRLTVAAVLGLRVVYGAVLVATPGAITKRWLGADAGTGPTAVALRGLGMREVVLHAGAFGALVRGTALRPWLAASIAGDLTDVLATVAERSRGLPRRAAPATVAVGGGAAALSILLARLVD